MSELGLSPINYDLHIVMERAFHLFQTMECSDSLLEMLIGVNNFLLAIGREFEVANTTVFFTF